MPLTITEEMIKQDPFFREGMKRGEKEGLEKGSKRERQRIVMSLYRKGKSFEEIAELLDITVEEVESLLNKKQ